jgi:hypothetical protein
MDPQLKSPQFVDLAQVDLEAQLLQNLFCGL